MQDSYRAQKMFDLNGRVALVTGATGHLGSAMAEALAEAGARVVVSSRDLAKAQSTARVLGGSETGRHLAVAIDHLDSASIDSGFDAVIAAAGQLDILVNNGHSPVHADWTTVDADA